MKWIVNTREDDESAHSDSLKIRSAAVAAGIPVTTTLAGFAEAVKGLEAVRRGGMKISPRRNGGRATS